jgi:Domain of unknown function (DUF4263)
MTGMQAQSSPIETAHYILAAEIRRRRLQGVEVTVDSSEWLAIVLREENRTAWLGYRPAAGYFLSWDREEPIGLFFQLDQQGISTVLSLAPPSNSSTDVDTAGESRARELLDSLSAAEPNAKRIQKILDETPASSEGIDILATIASLKTFRSAIDELRELMASQEEQQHAESSYGRLFSLYPWMLGSHYSVLLKKECEIWFDARVDLILGSALGYADVVELKRPDTRLLVESKRSKTWRPSQGLSDALAQARKYLRILDEHRLEILNRLSLVNQSVSRMYRSSVILVAGRTPVEEGALDALRDLNLENSRIIILTYDDVMAISESTIRLFERRLIGRTALLS